jgi:hypothetical protein
MRSPLGSVLRLHQFHGPQYRLQQNMPTFPTTGKLAYIQSLRTYIAFHVTLLRMNLYVATALTYLSQVPHGPISCTALPDIIEELQINSIPGSFFTRSEGYTEKDMKLFSYCQY